MGLGGRDRGTVTNTKLFSVLIKEGSTHTSARYWDECNTSDIDYIAIPHWESNHFNVIIPNMDLATAS